MAAIERGHAALSAVSRALKDVHFNRDAISARAADGYTVATDVADALILSGIPSRRAHELVGAAVATAERESRPLQESDLRAIAREAGLRTLHAPLDAESSVRAKRTVGSTHPEHVAAAIRALEEDLR
jgi:argininosuccinate lyase